MRIGVPSKLRRRRPRIEHVLAEEPSLTVFETLSNRGRVHQTLMQIVYARTTNPFQTCTTLRLHWYQIDAAGAKHLAAALKVNDVRGLCILCSHLTVTITIDTHKTGSSAEPDPCCGCGASGWCIVRERGERVIYHLNSSYGDNHHRHSQHWIFHGTISAM